MNALTEYRRPRPRHGLRLLERREWRALGGWRQGADGGWSRVYASSSSRKGCARRAVIFKKGGWWQWRVEEFDLLTRATRRVVQRNAAGRGYLDPAAAFPFADLGALSD